MRDWIENKILFSSVEQDGFGDTVRTYVAMLHDLHIRAGILNMIDAPLGTFSILNRHGFLHNILEAAHHLAANEYRKYRKLMRLLCTPRCCPLPLFSAQCRVIIVSDCSKTRDAIM